MRAAVAVAVPASVAAVDGAFELVRVLEDVRALLAWLFKQRKLGEPPRFCVYSVGTEYFLAFPRWPPYPHLPPTCPLSECEQDPCALPAPSAATR